MYIDETRETTDAARETPDAADAERKERVSDSVWPSAGLQTELVLLVAWDRSPPPPPITPPIAPPLTPPLPPHFILMDEVSNPDTENDDDDDDDDNDVSTCPALLLEVLSDAGSTDIYHI